MATYCTCHDNNNIAVVFYTFYQNLRIIVSNQQIGCFPLAVLMLYNNSTHSWNENFPLNSHVRDKNVHTIKIRKRLKIYKYNLSPKNKYIYNIYCM